MGARLQRRPPRAATEVLRVLRPGGIVAIGVEWNAKTDEQIVAETGYLPGSDSRIGSCSEILGLFEPRVDRVILAEDAPRQGERELAALLVIFSVRR